MNENFIVYSLKALSKRSFNARQKAKKDGRDVSPQILYTRISAEWRNGIGKDVEDERPVAFPPLAFACAYIIIACLSCIYRLGVVNVDRLIVRAIERLENGEDKF